MRKKIIQKMIVWLLTAMLCTSLCTDFAVRAEEGDAITEEEPEQAEAGNEEIVLTEEEPEGTGALEAEEQENEADIAPDETETTEEPSGEQEELEQSEEQIQMMAGNGTSLDLNPPRIETFEKGSEQEENSPSGQKVTWDCVYFGSYPQSEVSSSDPVYKELTSKEWGEGNDLVNEINGNRYCKIVNPGSKSRLTHWSAEGDYYFKYEPIKWRVLSVEEEKVLLLSDIVLDSQAYGQPVWSYSDIRGLLNNDFIDSAFTGNQRSAIANSKETGDKIFLLSDKELAINLYGFVGTDIQDEARRCQGSRYAEAKGLGYDGLCCPWWGRWAGNGGMPYIDVMGVVNTSDDNETDWPDLGVRPALWVNLSSLSSGEWKKAGTKSSDKWTDPRGDDDGDNNNDSNSGDNTGDSGSGSNTGGSGTGTASEKAVKVSEITLSGISKKIAAGKEIKLTAKVQPSSASNKSLTWKSSNTKVATVNSKGVVTLKKNSGGKTVTITATAKDGSEKKAAYKITSMKGVVKKITIKGKGTRKVKAGKNVSLKAKVTVSKSKKANKKLKWVSSNTKYATVTSTGKVKTKKAGKGKNVKITAMSTDGSGKKKSVTIKIR